MFVIQQGMKGRSHVEVALVGGGAVEGSCGGILKEKDWLPRAGLAVGCGPALWHLSAAGPSHSLSEGWPLSGFRHPPGFSLLVEVAVSEGMSGI